MEGSWGVGEVTVLAVTPPARGFPGSQGQPWASVFPWVVLSAGGIQVTNCLSKFQNKQKQQTRSIVIGEGSQVAWELDCVLPLVSPRGRRVWKTGILLPSVY